MSSTAIEVASDEDDDVTYEVRFSLGANCLPVGEWSEPHDAGVDDIIGEILAMNVETSETEKAGYIHAVRLRFYDVKAPVAEAADAHSDELIKHYSHLFINMHGMRAAVERKLGGEEFIDSLIVISEMAIYPKFRKQGLGLFAMSRLLEIFGGTGSVASLEPFPFQHGGHKDDVEMVKQLELNDFVDGKKAAFKKLENYWGKLGFVHVGQGIWAMHLARKHPTIETLGKGIPEPRKMKIGSETPHRGPNDVAKPVFMEPNFHGPSCGEPPDWGKQNVKGYKGYFVNAYGEQWMAYATKEKLIVTSGDISWKPIVVENPNYQELMMEATKVFITCGTAKGGVIEDVTGHVKARSFQGTVLNGPEAAWLAGVLYANVG